MKILVVDDEIDQVESLKRGLRSKGHVVHEALSAQEALNRLHNNLSGIELVITDYSMPAMNGLDLVKTIRQYHADIPVIMMTALAERSVMAEAARAGCDGFLAKPFNLDELIWEIEKVKVLSDICRRLPDMDNGEQNDF